MVLIEQRLTAPKQDVLPADSLWTLTTILPNAACQLIPSGVGLTKPPESCESVPQNKLLSFSLSLPLSSETSITHTYTHIIYI